MSKKDGRKSKEQDSPADILVLISSKKKCKKFVHFQSRASEVSEDSSDHDDTLIQDLEIC